MAENSGELSLNWRLIIAAGLGMGISPIMLNTMGLFIVALEAEFGWSRAMIASGLTANSFLAVLFGIFVGMLIDKFGPRRVAVPGIIVFCIAFGALSTVRGSPIHWWLLWLAVSFGSLLIKPTVWMAAIVSRFDRSRGMAIALTLCGASLSNILSPLVAGYLIENYGWRWAYVGLSLFWFVLAMPFILLFFFGMTDLKPRAKVIAEREEENLTKSSSALSEYLISLVFLKLATVATLIMFISTACFSHFIPMLVESGIDITSASLLASLIGISSFGGRLLSGTLLDRYDGKKIGGVLFFMLTFVFIGLIFVDGSLILAALIAILFGICFGAEMEVLVYLSSRFFGTDHFGALFGVISALLSVSAGLGPLIAGYAYDLLSSYTLALWLAVPLSLLASLIVFTLGNGKHKL